MAIDCLAGYLYSCKMEGTIALLPSHMNEINIAKVAKEMELEIESVENFVNMVTALALSEIVLKVPEHLKFDELEQDYVIRLKSNQAIQSKQF